MTPAPLKFFGYVVVNVATDAGPKPVVVCMTRREAREYLAAIGDPSDHRVRRGKIILQES